MNRIVIFGLQYEPNLGDNVIGECCEWLVRRACDELSLKEVEIISADMLGRHQVLRYVSSVSRISDSSIKMIIKKTLPIKMLDCINNIRNSVSDWKNSFATRERAKQIAESVINKDTKAIIFAGGGIIKFQAQEFYLLIDVITEIAEKARIPVMFNAVGVEGYNQYSVKCRQLEKALNRDCVRVITTRDDVDLLRNKYLRNNKSCIIEQVADSAFWSDVVYEGSFVKSGSDIIGLSVARGGLFSDHGIPIRENDLICFWKQLTSLLDERHIKWSFFCNGAFPDYDFLEKLLCEPEYCYRKSQIALERATSGKELVKQMSNFSAVIACRLHAGIISYSLGIPEIMLIWNNKQIKFSEFIQYPNRYLEHTEFSAENAIDKVLKAINEGYPVYEKETKRNRTYDFIKEFICENVGR